jgi:hypothetical protein
MLEKIFYMFNTGFPYPESDSDPVGNFERSLNAKDATQEELDNFYSKNFEYHMGLQYFANRAAS